MSEVTVISAPAPCTLDEVRRRAVPVLRKAGAKRAVVFGSWARGQADGYSDLDLAVVMDTDLPRPQRAPALAKELDRALPVVVDLLVYTPEEFAAGEADPFGVFDLFRREGIEILRGAPMTGDAQARRWLDAAVDDLRHARYAEEGGFHAHACFSAQQAADKAVKAVHYARGARAVLGHSVRNLIERLDPGIPSLDELLDHARELDLHYIPTRYPNGLEAWTPATGFGARQAASAIAGASAILTAARRHSSRG